MPKNILERYSSDLATRVESANDATKRAVSLAVCKWAVESTIPDDATVRSALAALGNSACGEQGLMNALQRHVDDLDLAYFEAQKAKCDFFPLSVKARVANAVLFALDPDPFRAATHALYELCAALGTELVQGEVNRRLS